MTESALKVGKTKVSGIPYLITSRNIAKSKISIFRRTLNDGIGFKSGKGNGFWDSLFNNLTKYREIIDFMGKCEIRDFFISFTYKRKVVMLGLEKKLTLYGFNNLTKTLSFNIYDVCYAKTEREQKDYIAYIDEQYNSDRLTNILCNVTEMIGAQVLNISKQDYDPQGASVNILIAENSLSAEHIDESCNQGKFIQNLPHDTVHAHLDKSHVTVHTFPEYHPDNSISTFRVDIDVSTCGEVSPLNTLDYLIGSFDSDIITIDYRVRGFTRDLGGRKYFIDHSITSIQDYIDDKTLTKYDAIDVNVYQSNIFHTKMLIKEINLQNYLFNQDVYELPPKKRLEITDNLRREMIEIFSGMNIY